MSGCFRTSVPRTGIEPAPVSYTHLDVYKRQGIPTATTNLSHIVIYSLKGANKIPNFIAPTLPPTTGIASVTVADAIQLYPNPSSSKAIVAINLKKDEQVMVSVIDMQGKEVMQPIRKQFNAGAQQLELNTAQVQNGIYFVKIAAGSTSANIKMMVMH